MARHLTSDQLRFINEWFRTWSDYQKDEFIHVLGPKLTTSSSSTNVNGITDGMQGISINTNGRPPTIFACQMKLFNEWWATWKEEDRAKLTEELKKTDAKFWEDLEAQMNGTRKHEEDDFFTVDDVDVTEVPLIPASSKENMATGINITVPAVEKPESDLTVILEVGTGSNGHTNPTDTEFIEVDGSDETQRFKTTIEVMDSTNSEEKQE